MNTLRDALQIGFRFCGFQGKRISQIVEIPRGANSELIVTLPMQREKNGKTSCIIQFSIAGTAVFFPVFMPADSSSEDDTCRKFEVTPNGRYTLKLHGGDEGIVVIAEKRGENFQITLVDLWEPTWISSCFGDIDTVSRHFGSHFVPWRRECVARTIAALEYEAAERQANKQTEKERQCEKKCIEEKRLAAEKLRIAEAKERADDAQEFLERLGLGRKKEE